MKTVLIAVAVLAGGASASAGLAPSSANSIDDSPLTTEPPFAFKVDMRLRDTHTRATPDANAVPAEAFDVDLRVRDQNGRVRPDLMTRHAPPPPVPKPITPRGDGEIYALRGPRGPQIPPPAKMPMIVVDGVEIDPRMPMKTPDPTVDYKLHVREAPSLAPEAAKK